MEKKKTTDDTSQGRLIHLHPAWQLFIKYCQAVQNGEIDKLKIQDGLPLLAEEVKKKIKFGDEE